MYGAITNFKDKRKAEIDLFVTGLYMPGGQISKVAGILREYNVGEGIGMDGLPTFV